MPFPATVTAGSSAVILGTGGVGLNVIQGAKISGAAKIIAKRVARQQEEIAFPFFMFLFLHFCCMPINLVQSILKLFHYMHTL